MTMNSYQTNNVKLSDWIFELMLMKSKRWTISFKKVKKAKNKKKKWKIKMRRKSEQTMPKGDRINKYRKINSKVISKEIIFKWHNLASDIKPISSKHILTRIQHSTMHANASRPTTHTHTHKLKTATTTNYYWTN